MENYNAYSIKTLKKFATIVEKLQENNSELVNEGFGGRNDYADELSKLFKDEFVIAEASSFCQYFYDKEIKADDIIEKTFYRIGEPILDIWQSNYKPSYNFADDRPECGISVVTSDWLESFKAIFFGAHDDKYIESRGVYKLKGIVVGHGGDNEPLVYATDYAEKTNIKTYNELFETVSNN